MPIVTIQRRMMELGRVRLGEKGAKGEPKRLNSFRFTSASQALLAAVAEQHGGQVRPWQGAPDEGYFEVTTEATRLDIILPPVFSDEDGTPTLPYSQWFELWSGGGCQRRCDGQTESLTGKPCMCDPERRRDGDPAMCKVVTRVSFMLPDLPGLGVWRIDSHGWNAAVELPGTLEVLAAAAREQRFVPAVLSIQHRTKKQPGQPTKRFIVPVIELPDVTVRQLASGDVPLAINAPAPAPAVRPALPAAPDPPAESFENEQRPAMGSAPALPGEDIIDVVEPLTADEFIERVRSAELSKQRIGAAGRKLFPGRNAATLTDEERGALWVELAPADDAGQGSFADMVPAGARGEA